MQTCRRAGGQRGRRRDGETERQRDAHQHGDRKREPRASPNGSRRTPLLRRRPIQTARTTTTANSTRPPTVVEHRAVTASRRCSIADPCAGVHCGEHGACSGGACTCESPAYTGDRCQDFGAPPTPHPRHRQGESQEPILSERLSANPVAQTEPIIRT